MKPLERPFLNIATIVSKFPWSEVDCEIQRDALFDVCLEATKIAIEKSKEDASKECALFDSFVRKLVRYFLNRFIKIQVTNILSR